MNRRQIILTASILSIVALTAGAAMLAYSKYNPPHHVPPATTAKDVITKTLANPSKTQLTASTYTSKAGPNEPSYITLPTVSTKGYIQKVGIDQYGQMAAPTNVHLAGWYVNSLLPGQTGLSIIDGHTDGYSHNQGIFGRLSQLKTGDIFTVTFGNGSSKSFTVKSLQLVAASDVSSVLFAHDPAISSQLNLITCGGNYDSVSQTYDKRTIVISALIL